MVPEDARYTREHEWLRETSDGTIVFGITDYAQDALGDIVYVDLPAVGTKLTAHTPCGEVESTKSVSDVYSPLSGEITEVNGATETNPETVNEAPYESGWLFKLRLSDTGELDALLDAGAYAELIKEA